LGQTARHAGHGSPGEGRVLGLRDDSRAAARLADSGVAVAVGSRSQESADRFADKFGVANRHASYSSLVADPDVDVIYVATPHPMHHESAILALRAGKHVLVEKPFTMNAAEAREIVQVARERGLFAMEAMWTRFLPHVTVIRDWLARGVLGELVTVTADHGQWFAEDVGFRLFAPELGGGALLDLGVYPVSFASMVLGRPSRDDRDFPAAVRRVPLFRPRHPAADLGRRHRGPDARPGGQGR
jgi:predicted dehydrogenase